MDESFLAQTLNSKQLLALLYVCERRRKNQPLTESDLSGTKPTDWQEFKDTFYPRLQNLGETMRFEVLEAHLMSVEDIDIYNNEVLRELLEASSNVMQKLTTDLQGI